MMQPPHIAQLGELLSDHLAKASDSQPVRIGLDYSPALQLQTGQRDHIPVIAVPGAGASITSFTDLVAALGSAWHVLGMQPRGLDGIALPHGSIEAAADCYLKSLQTLWPKGPIHLLGHSHGAVVTFEMARRLSAAGRHIASLTLIDAGPPDPTPDMLRDLTDVQVMEGLIDIFTLAAGTPLGLEATALCVSPFEEQLAQLHAALVRVGLMPERTLPEVLRGPIAACAAAFRTSYYPQSPYPGPTRIVFARDIRLNEKADWHQRTQHEQGWRRWAPNLDVWHGPGNHLTILKPPHVQSLATWWQKGDSGKQSTH